MDSLNIPNSTNNNTNSSGRDSDNGSEDDRDVSPARKAQKHRKRKASMITIKDNAKSKINLLSRTSKGRRSLSQTAHEMSETFRFLSSLHQKSNHISESSALEDDEELQLNKMTLDDKNGDRRISLLDENETKNPQLEDRLDNENGLDITGIMNLSAMNITDDNLRVIIQRAFSGGRKKCTGLILRDNFLTSIGVKMIVDAIVSSRSMIKYLSFSNNPDVRDDGIEHLVGLLGKNRHITFLAVPNTNITDRSVRLLADILCGVDPETTVPPLEKLYIAFNKGITDESLPALVQIIEQNQTLKILSLENCSLTDKARKSLRQMISKNKKKKFSLTA